MSVLGTYIHWANSVLAETGGRVEGVEALQDGKVLCELIDVLDPEANLLVKVKASGEWTPLTYTSTALEHMRGQGIRVKFQAQDIVGNDVKVILDVLWALILHYSIHSIGHNVQYRTVGEGKRKLLEWCQEVLNATFDPSDTLSFILCHGNWFVKLLEKATQNNMEVLQSKPADIDDLLKEIEHLYNIKRDIIKASDVVEGTVDEHTLMIYLSLLKRRMPPVNSQDRPSVRDDHTFNSPTQDRPPVKDDHTFNSPSQDRPPARDDHTFNSPAQVQLPTRDDHTFNSLTQDRQPARDNHTFNSLAFTEEGLQGASSSARRRSSITIAGLNPHSLSGSTLGDDELAQSPTQLDFSVEYILPGNVFSSQTTRERLLEHLPEVGVDRYIDKDTDSRKVNEKEDNRRSEFSNSSLTRDKSASGNHSDLQRTKQLTQNGALKHQGEHPQQSVNISLQLNTVHNSSKASPDTAQRRIDNKSDVPHAEQRSERILEYRYQKNPSEEAIRITRPTDYIRQWKDTVHRLSTVSLTDDLGTPVSPLISHYKASLPWRSKSMDVGGFRYRNSTRSSLEHHYPLASRSRSSDALSTVDVFPQNHLIHSSNISQAQSDGHTELATSHERNISHEVDQTSIHTSHHQETSHFSVHASEAEDPDVKETDPVRGNTLTRVPPVSLTSHSPESHVLGNRNEQTILKKRFRSEPPSSGSRVRFQQQKYVTSDYQQQSHSAGHETVSHGTSVPATSHRYRSLSPQRHTVSLARHAADGAVESRLMLSVSPRHRSPPPQQLQPTAHVRKQEANSRNIHVNIFPEVSPAFVSSRLPGTASMSSQLPGMASQQYEHDINVRLSVEDDRSSKIHSVSIFPGVGLAENSDNTYKLSSTSYLENQYVDNIEEGRDYSPPSIRRGGVGRVPRREAWEQEIKQTNEDVSVLGNETDSQLRVIEVLFKEIEMLREKVEMLEQDDSRHRFEVPTQPAAARSTTSSISPTSSRYRDRNNHILLSDRISAPASTGQVRALSCPLLKLSRRSKATRSLSRNSAQSRLSEAKTTLDSCAANLDLPLTKFDCGANHGLEQFDRQNVDYNQPAHTIKSHIYSADLNRSLEPINLMKWKQLISLHDLTKSEVIELKQGMACALAENDILQAKLNNARQEVHDKLRHTNGVLEDCRQHLAKSQTENIQLRVMLKEEQRRSDTYRSRITDLENSILQMKTAQQHLEHELDHTAMLLDDSVTKTLPEVDALRAENFRLVSRLVTAQHEGDDLREEVQLLIHKQTKAMDTMDEFRKCLARTRHERQELFDELTTFKDHEQRNKVREISKIYQEKGTQDEWEKEQCHEGDTLRLGFSDAGSGVNTDFQRSPSNHRLPQSLSKSSNSSMVRCQDGGQYNRYCEDREISPHRTYHMYYSRSRSPRHEGRSTSLPGYSHPLSMDESFLDPDIQERKHYIQTRKTIVDSNIQSSRPRLHCSRSPDRCRSPTHSSYNPRHIPADSPQKHGYFSPCSVQYRLNRSFTPPEDLTCAPSQYIAHLDTTTDNRRDKQVAEPRSNSPRIGPHFPYRRSDDCTPSSMSASVERNSDKMTLEQHSPPTRLSPGEKERSHTSRHKRRPLHSKTEAGEIARKLQKEFDKEDQMITLISKCPRSKPWFDELRESDAEDTGINSSMSSRSSYEHLFARKRAPFLTEQQRQYADQLVQKYTGQISHKQPV